MKKYILIFVSVIFVLLANAQGTYDQLKNQYDRLKKKISKTVH